MKIFGIGWPLKESSLLFSQSFNREILGKIKMILTQEVLKRVLDYNPEAGLFTWKRRDISLFSHCQKPKNVCNMWNTKYADTLAGCVHTSLKGRQYIHIDIFGKQYKAHRLAYFFMNGELPQNQIDHINGNGLDNRWENLRHVSNLENSKNQKLAKNSSTGVSGVSWHKRLKAWQARISVNCERKHLGYFDSFTQASDARFHAEKKYGYHQNHGRLVNG